MATEARLAELAARTAPASAPFSVQRLPGQASNRVYFRLSATQGASLIAMVLPPDSKAAEEMSSGAAPTELPFLNVQRYLERAAVPVPAIRHQALEEGVLLLEDLGDQTLERALATSSAAELYGQAVDLLADLRVRAEAHPDPACVAFGRDFEQSLYRWELDHYLYWGFVARLATDPTPEEAAILRRSFDSIAERLAALPRGFTHRDYQSRNLMLSPDPGRGLVVIDFQDALLGPRQYDLVALLRDSYVELPAALVEGLVERYVERVQTQTRVPIDLADFRRTFDLLTVQRKLKDGGRFVFIDRVKGNPNFLPAVPASFRYVAQALARLPELAELREVLRGRHPEMG